MNNSRRSYHDTLNAGRQRRPNLTLDELNRSLATLEARLHGPFEAAVEYRASRPSAAEIARDEALRGMVREIEQARVKEEGVAVAGRIASEIRNLRSDLSLQREAQRDLSTTLRGEFDALRREIERSPKPRVELDAEAAQGKGALGEPVRDDGPRSMEERWDALERRLGDFENKLSGESLTGNAALANLHSRLEELHRSVGDLPTSQSMREFEERLRMLASLVDQFARNQTKFGPDMLAALEGRLDEIGSAVKAAAPQTPDPQPFERIESQLSAVSRQVEDLKQQEAPPAVMQRLAQLSARVDELASKANLPAKAVEQLAAQVAIIAAKLDQAGAPVDPDFVFRAIEQRFDTLSAMLERRQGDAAERAGLLFRDLERRLDEVVDRLDAQRSAANPEAQNQALTAALDARFTDFAKRFEGKAQAAPAMSATDSKLMRSLEAQVTVLTEHLAKPQPAERQLHALMPRLDSMERSLERQHEAVLKAAREAAESTVSTLVAGAPPAMDISTVVQDLRALEAQVTILTEHLTQSLGGDRQLAAIAPRLQRIEHSLERQEDAIMRAAREAAESTVSAMAANGLANPAVSGLAQDLKSLEALTRRSDDRNAKTFEAIHDTLIKIVDRLGTLETAESSVTMPEGADKIAIADAPSLDLGSSPEFPVIADGAVGRSPTEAASAAAIDAVADDLRATEPAGRGRSMLGGLSRAFGGRKDRNESTAIEAPKTEGELPPPEFDLDQPLDPKLANQPLEPGSGSPDLSAIMRRVRDERTGAARGAKEPDAAKSDFIAAARRAAQAAAAEAEILKQNADPSAPARGGKLTELMRNKRKSVLMAVGAIMIALAGFQATRFLPSDGAWQTATAALDASTEPAAAPETEPTVMAAAPAATQEPEAAMADEVVADGAAPETDGETAPDTASAGAAPPRTVAVPAAALPFALTPAAPPVASAPAPDGVQTAALPEAPKAAEAKKLPGGLEIPASIDQPALRQAAAEGDAKALWAIGSRLGDGRKEKADLAAAAKWFEAAADLGLAPAQYRIGSIYEKGTGVKRDPGVAKTWYQLAADAGNASAMHNLAVLYAMGAAGVTDNELAARWFTSAADFGVKDSQFNLGIMAAKGVGMKQDLEASYKWFALVAKTGDKDAASKRDEVAGMLKPDALKRARGATELWKAKPLDAKANSVDIPPAWQPAPATTASVDMKAAVKTIQLILAKNGYEPGGSDGVMGAKTKAAIVAFQKDNKLPATGEVDEKLVKALLARK